jgi:hypothetical protein
MGKESEQPKREAPVIVDFVPFKLPGLITPFNIGDVISIQAINERNRPRVEIKPQDKK